MNELATLARFPFLPEAGAYIEKNGVSLEELLLSSAFAAARLRGKERVIAALETGELPTRQLPQSDTSNEDKRELLDELLSHAYARILVSALADAEGGNRRGADGPAGPLSAHVVRRHALAEAVRARNHLLDDESTSTLAACARAVGLDFDPDGPEWCAHFTEYLKQSVHLKDLEWKLVRQPLQKGIVRMDARTASRLVQEALRRRIESELPRPLAPEVPKMATVKGDLAPIRDLAQAMKERYDVSGSFGKVDLALLPPCMQHILGELQRGENAAHNARFATVTFLHKIGMTSEDIMRLFSQAPDFKEELTRYQVEHITGVSSGTSYSVPGCDNLQTFNLCYADDVCRSRTKAGAQRVRYPGDYYRYMQEAKPLVDALTARLPVQGADGLTRALAENYGMLKTVAEIVASPRFATIAPPPGKELVFDANDKWAIPRLAASLVGSPQAGGGGPRDGGPQGTARSFGAER